MFGIKTIAAALALSTVGSISMAGAAQADTWVLNAAACPDLREDRRDRRHYDGRRDRREDFRDRRVIDCPPRAWRYEAGRWDRHYGHPRCHPAYRQKIVDEMRSYGRGLEAKCDVQQPRPTDAYERKGAATELMTGTKS